MTAGPDLTHPTSGRVPPSTYRLQITANFTLDDAAAQVDYLADLGVGWIYLSPVLEAEKGSDHGYDVIDHGRVDPARGGPDALRRVCDAAHAAGLGVLIDIVPNHVGVATAAASVWWWDLLANGPESRYHEAFDVDWAAGGGKLLMPILGSADDIAKLEVDGDELVYFDNRLPIAPGTGGGTPQQVHARQHYELIDWRRGDSELNYRRFFAVTTLAAIRVELPAVFDESHAEISRWIHDGLADGLRVDHPDGVFDPSDYLDRLAAATGGTYVLVEKILEPGENLPTHWRCDGTTGYDAMGVIDRLFVDPAGEPGSDRAGHRTAGRGAGGLGGPHPRHQAHRRRRLAARRGQSAGPAGPGRRPVAGRPGGRDRRAAGLLPGVPDVPRAFRRRGRQGQPAHRRRCRPRREAPHRERRARQALPPGPGREHRCGHALCCGMPPWRWPVASSRPRAW